MPGPLAGYFLLFYTFYNVCNGYNALINRILYEKNSYIHILESKLNSFYEAQAKAKAKAELEEDIDKRNSVRQPCSVCNR